MLELYFRAARTITRFRASPAGLYLDDFAVALRRARYGHVAGGHCLRQAVHFGRWADRQDIPVAAIDEWAISEFETHLPECRCVGHRAGSHVRAGAGVRAFLKYMRSAGLAAPAPAVGRPEKVQEALDGLCDWMRSQRGVRDVTLRTYAPIVASLLDRLGTDPVCYTAGALRGAVLDQAAGHGICWAKNILTATRMYLRYLAAAGHCSPYLCDGIPKVAHWRQTTLPKHLARTDVERLIESCRPAQRSGLRDRAVLLLLARLGLRASDIVNLRLSDIDWANGNFRVAGKGRVEARLPLPQDAGDALLAYIEGSRPEVGFDQVFLSVRAPVRPLTTSGAVTGIVAQAIQRAGISAPMRGAYLLRHSAACTMLADGASLTGIGVVLRHRSIETSANYARVDMHLLRQVAQPWPELASC